MKVTEYEDKLNQRWERVCGVEEEWKRFKEAILKVGEEIRRVVGRKKEYF